MIDSRVHHGCSIIRHNGAKSVVVVGGYNSFVLNTVEFLNLKSFQWIQGPGISIHKYFVTLTATNFSVRMPKFWTCFKTQETVFWYARNP